MAERDDDVSNLSDIYDALKGDAKTIVQDLKGGVRMWSEAAGANIAAGGFLLLHALASYRIYSAPAISSEGGLIILAEGITAAMLFAIAAKGFSKFFKLRKKYAPLFEKADRLE
ncbi:MAG: hypothetical protein ABI361_11920 [Nitrososphaera sp.]|jgi:hypothetical protein